MRDFTLSVTVAMHASLLALEPVRINIAGGVITLVLDPAVLDVDVAAALEANRQLISAPRGEAEAPAPIQRGEIRALPMDATAEQVEAARAAADGRTGIKHEAFQDVGGKWIIRPAVVMLAEKVDG